MTANKLPSVCRYWIVAVCPILLCLVWPAAATEPGAGPTKPVRKIYLMTDMEGVAGVRDAEQWLSPGDR